MPDCRITEEMDVIFILSYILLFFGDKKKNNQSWNYLLDQVRVISTVQKGSATEGSVGCIFFPFKKMLMYLENYGQSFVFVVDKK